MRWFKKSKQTLSFLLIFALVGAVLVEPVMANHWPNGIGHNSANSNYSQGYYTGNNVTAVGPAVLPPSNTSGTACATYTYTQWQNDGAPLDTSSFAIHSGAVNNGNSNVGNSNQDRKDQFFNFLQTTYNAGNTTGNCLQSQKRYGAAFTVHTLLGKLASDVVSPTVTATDWADLRKRLDAPNIFLMTENNFVRSENSFAVRGSQLAGHTGSNIRDLAYRNEALSEPTIVLRNGGPTGQIVYALKRRCGNPTGVLPGLPKHGSIDGEKVGISSTGPTSVGNFSNDRVTVTSDNYSSQQQAQRFTFTEVPPGTAKIMVTDIAHPETPDPPWVLKGYTICDGSTQNCGPSPPASGNLPGHPYQLGNYQPLNYGQTVDITVPSGKNSTIVFYYEQAPAAGQWTDVCSKTTAGTRVPGAVFNVWVGHSSTGPWNVDHGERTTHYRMTSSFPYYRLRVLSVPDGYAFRHWEYPGGTSANTQIIFSASAYNGREICIVMDEVDDTHKVYGASRIDITPQFVRDNQHLTATISTYFWPDAGRRAINSDRQDRRLLAGIWGMNGQGQGGSDNAGNESSHRADPNNISTYFNTVAEANCHGVHGCRLPLAYVTQNDGSGTSSTTVKDGSTTPNGNQWVSIRERSFNQNYIARLGGIASNQNRTVGGETGNHIRNVEISNIRIEAVGTNPATRNDLLQGGINNSFLQPGATGRNLNLPAGSQGPIQGGQPFNAWDNIRNPNLSGSDFTQNVTSAPLDFINSGGSPANFTNNPLSMQNIFSGRAQTVATVRLTSLLQDGNDRDNLNQYTRGSEPLTYTANISVVNQMRIKWDEYIEWSQADDKGHYYTNRAPRATGIDWGSPDGNFNTTVNTITLTNSGSSQFQSRTWTCHNSSTGTTHNHFTTNPNYNANDHHPGTNTTCWVSSESWTQQQQYCVNNTRVAYNTTSRTYYTPSNESRYGWYNTQTTTQLMPYGGHNSTAQSAFYPSYSSNPSWTNTGNTAYWQDASITSMSNSGSSLKPARSQRWIYNTSDPAYTNRQIFNTATSSTRRSGWFRTGTECIWRYPNGSHTTGTTNAWVDTYWPNSSLMYESTTNPTTPEGMFNFTFDGAKDNVVDTGWAWTSNWQRVRYENTYNGRFRRIGPYSPDGSAGGQIFGLEGDNVPMQAARGMSTITNPVLELHDADIYAGGPVHSYFQNTAAHSAFIFTGSSQIVHYNNDLGRFYNYWFNPNERVATRYQSAGEEAVRSLITDYDELSDGAVTLGSSLSGTRNLNQGGVFKRTGDLTLGNTTFTNGAGTIIVEGDLTINGNLAYGSGTTRDNLPSVGFIVTGDIRVAPSVTSLVGAYFSGGCFHSGSVTVSGSSCTSVVGNTNRTTSDSQLNVQGLVVARHFVLARQTVGSFAGPVVAERFTYDPRIVINSPPGFARIFTAPAVWNEGVPGN